MSIVSTVANYGGRVQDYQQSIKQFYVSSQLVTWIYKKLSSNLVVITPADAKKPVLINNDLIVTGSIFNTSDERLKVNINNIDEKDIENLFTLNPIHFNYKKTIQNKHYGFLAQEVEKVFPELVENNNNDGYKTVNYIELIPLMFTKLKCMQKDLDELKDMVGLQN